jgi:hypothetical protein
MGGMKVGAEARVDLAIGPYDASPPTSGGARRCDMPQNDRDFEPQERFRANQ